MKNRIALIILILLGSAAAVLVIQSGRHIIRTSPEKARMVNAAMPVETARAEVIQLDEVIGASGEVQQIATVSLTAGINSRILEIPVDIGSLVQKGDLLIRWDRRLFEAALESAEERVQNADVQLKHASQQLDRLRTLLSEGMGSLLEVEEAEVAHSEARLERAASLQELTKAKLDLENTVLLSPVGGMILGRAVNPGENTTPDQLLLMIGELDHVLMAADVGEEKLSSIFLGQKAEAAFDAYPGEKFEGQVVKIDPKTDSETRSFKAFIKIANPDLRLKPGLTGFAKMFRQSSSLAVPSIALMKPGGDRPMVFVVDDSGRARLREVTIGMTSNGLTQILKGIRKGERVVTVGQLYLEENDAVNPEVYADVQ